MRISLAEFSQDLLRQKVRARLTVLIVLTSTVARATHSREGFREKLSISFLVKAVYQQVQPLETHTLARGASHACRLHIHLISISAAPP